MIKQLKKYCNMNDILRILFPRPMMYVKSITFLQSLNSFDDRRN